MRKRYYIFIVTHDWDGQMRRLSIPVQWVVLFVVFALIGAGTLLGLAGSYSRMLAKVEAFNRLRSRQEQLAKQLQHAQKDVTQSRAEVASLGSLASEVTALYDLSRHTSLRNRLVQTRADETADLYNRSLNNFRVLESSALESAANPHWTVWRPSVHRPEGWPVRGPITSPFGERPDPFSGERSFHPGIDIGVHDDTPIHATAGGEVIYAGWMRGYGRVVIVNDGGGYRTLFAHMASLAVTVGQQVDRGDVLGFSGDSGWSTGPHVHYEVRIHNLPVNPYRYLRR